MTDYFEVHARDAAARVGELRLRDPVVTPALADDVLADAGSQWVQHRDRPEGDESQLTVLPHRGFPSGTAEEVQASFAPEYPDVDFPSAAVVSPQTAADYGADAYVLSGAPGVVGHGAAFEDAVVETREAIPDDTALYLSGVATPRNVAVLVYAGVDLVDADRAVIRGTQGRYLTTEGEYDLAALDELPCSCAACRQPVAEFDRGDCVDHNVAVLEAELARVRRRIRDGRLRDYVEGQARHEAWATAAFRELDQEYAYVEERTPAFRDSLLLSATEDALRRVEIQRFADRVTSRYRKRLDGHPLLLVPCSAAKPYSDSQSHRQFQDAASYRAHVVSMTSPIGVVPQELELTYPAQHYDSVVTGRWSAEETDFVARVLRRYLERTDYSRVLAHVPPEGYREVCERVEREVDVPFEYTVEDHPTTDASLGELNAALAGEDTIWVEEREEATLKAVADYFVGDGAGDELFGDLTVQGRYPKLQALDSDGEQLAALVPQYGSLSFTLAGARRWVDSDAPTKRVEIDAFVPEGSVLAPGVVDASDDIRVGDEVVVEGPTAFAVGRAEMPGPAMVDSTRGIAVQVRHSEET
ncbi:archaeosine synthase subunit alpha [Halobacterium yunchengense]|uniref:archaeosine synthase subunit alpha n=1 Tax=Halobacterium yunchengense TaxID=3108497 RepID=UPI0030081678